MTEENLVTAAAKLYRVRKSIMILWGKDYYTRISWYCDELKKIMNDSGKSEFEAMLLAVEVPSVKENTFATMAFMAAAIEILEQNKNQ